MLRSVAKTGSMEDPPLTEATESLHVHDGIAFVESNAVHRRNLEDQSSTMEWSVILVLTCGMLLILHVLFLLLRSSRRLSKFQRYHPFPAQVGATLRLDPKTYIGSELETLDSLINYTPGMFVQYIYANLQLLIIENTDDREQCDSLEDYFCKDIHDVSHFSLSYPNLARLCYGTNVNHMETKTARLYWIAKLLADAMRKPFRFARRRNIRGMCSLEKTMFMKELAPATSGDTTIKYRVFQQWANKIEKNIRSTLSIVLADPADHTRLSLDDTDPEFMPVNIKWKNDETNPWEETNNMHRTAELNPWTVIIGEENIAITLHSVNGNDCPVEFTTREKASQTMSVQNECSLAELKSQKCGLRLRVEAFSERPALTFAWKAIIPGWYHLKQSSRTHIINLSRRTANRLSSRKEEFCERLRQWCHHPTCEWIMQSLPVPQGTLHLPTINNVDGNIISDGHGWMWTTQDEKQLWTNELPLSSISIKLEARSPIVFCTDNNEPTDSLSYEELCNARFLKVRVIPTEESLYASPTKWREVRFKWQLRCSHEVHEGKCETYHSRLFTFDKVQTVKVEFGDKLPPLYKREYLLDMYHSIQFQRCFEDKANEVTPDDNAARLESYYQTLTLRDAHKHLKEYVGAKELLDTNHHSWILFQGSTGVGKSTLFQHFAQSWSLDDDAEQNTLSSTMKNKFSWVFYINLLYWHDDGDTNETNCLGSLLIYTLGEFEEGNRGCADIHTGTKIEQNDAESILQYLLTKRKRNTDDSNVLFLLDGWDKVRDNSLMTGNVGRRLVEMLRKSGALVFIASRFSSHVIHQDGSEHPSVEKYMDYVMTVDGLDSQSRLKFIEQYAQDHNIDETDIVQWSQQQSEQTWDELTWNPLILEAICSSYMNKTTSFYDDVHGKDMPIGTIFYDTVEHLVHKWLACVDKLACKVKHSTDIKDFVRGFLQEVHSDESITDFVNDTHEAVARAIEQGNAYSEATGCISLARLQQIFTELQPDRNCMFLRNENATSFFEGLGLVQAVNLSEGSEKQYEFIHRSYWEYFLALSHVKVSMGDSLKLDGIHRRGRTWYSRFLVYQCNEREEEELESLLDNMYKWSNRDDKEEQHRFFLKLLGEVAQSSPFTYKINFDEIAGCDETVDWLFFMAGEMGNFVLLKWLISQCQLYSTPGNTPTQSVTLARLALRGAVTNSQFDCVCQILNEYKMSHVDLCESNDKWDSPIYISSSRGYADCLRLLLQRVSSQDISPTVKYESWQITLQKQHYCCAALLLIWTQGSISQTGLTDNYWLNMDFDTRLQRARDHLNGHDDLLRVLRWKTCPDVHQLSKTGKDVSFKFLYESEGSYLSPVWYAVMLGRPSMISALHRQDAAVDGCVSCERVTRATHGIASLDFDVGARHVRSLVDRLSSSRDNQGVKELTPYVLSSCLGQTGCMNALERTGAPLSTDTDLSCGPVRAAVACDQNVAIAYMLHQQEETDDKTLEQCVTWCLYYDSNVCLRTVLHVSPHIPAASQSVTIKHIPHLQNWLNECLRKDASNCFMEILDMFQERWRRTELIQFCAYKCVEHDSIKCFLRLLVTEVKTNKFGPATERGWGTVEECVNNFLYLAVTGNSVRCVEELITTDPWLQYITMTSIDNALSEAWEHGSLQCMIAIEKQYFGVSISTEQCLHTEEHIFFAAKYGLTQLVQTLANNLTVCLSSLSTPKGKYPLICLAAVNGRSKCLRYFLRDLTVNASAASIFGENIVFAASLSGNVECLNELRRNKVNVNWDQRTTYGLLPIHAACISGSTECIHFFMESRTSIPDHLLQVKWKPEWFSGLLNHISIPTELTQHILDGRHQAKVSNGRFTRTQIVRRLLEALTYTEGGSSHPSVSGVLYDSKDNIETDGTGETSVDSESIPKHPNLLSGEKQENGTVRWLSHVQALDLSRCNEPVFTNDAFRYIGHLSQLQILEMSHCNQLHITDTAFQHLARLSRLCRLDISSCNQSTITDAAFEHIAAHTSIRSLTMRACDQDTITTKAFQHIRHLTELRELTLAACNQSTITDKAFEYIGELSHLQALDMSACNQSEISNAAFKHLGDLSNLRELNMSACHQSTITDQAFEHIGRISQLKTLRIAECNQSTITDDAFPHVVRLRQLQKLYMWGCNQSTLTDIALQRIRSLPELKMLNIADCHPSALTKEIVCQLQQHPQLQALRTIGWDRAKPLPNGTHQQQSRPPSPPNACNKPQCG